MSSARERRLAIVACVFPLCASAADGFRQLSAADIRSRVVGQVITDEAHWSDHFRSDGTLRAVELGNDIPGAWKLHGDELCMTRRYKAGPETQCYEVWMKGDSVEYRRDGVTTAYGVLRPE
jgi:hypothetical protein